MPRPERARHGAGRQGIREGRRAGADAEARGHEPQEGGEVVRRVVDLRPGPVPRAGLEEELAVVRVGGRVDEQGPDSVQARPRHRAQARERVVGGRGQQELVPLQQRLAQCRTRAVRPGERDVDRAVLQPLQQAGRVRLLEVQTDRRMRAVEGADRRRHRRGQRGRDQPDAQLGRAPAGQRAGRLAGALGRAQRVQRLGQEGRARLRQRHAARRALEEPHAQLVLERTDLRAERRLRDPQLARGLREARGAGDGREVAQVAELHAAPYRRRMAAEAKLYWAPPRAGDRLGHSSPR